MLAKDIRIGAIGQQSLHGVNLPIQHRVGERRAVDPVGEGWITSAPHQQLDHLGLVMSRGEQQRRGVNHIPLVDVRAAVEQLDDAFHVAQYRCNMQRDLGPICEQKLHDLSVPFFRRALQRQARHARLRVDLGPSLNERPHKFEVSFLRRRGKRDPILAAAHIWVRPVFEQHQPRCRPV